MGRKDCPTPWLLGGVSRAGDASSELFGGTCPHWGWPEWSGLIPGTKDLRYTWGRVCSQGCPRKYLLLLGYPNEAQGASVRSSGFAAENIPELLGLGARIVPRHFGITWASKSCFASFTFPSFLFLLRDGISIKHKHSLDYSFDGSRSCLLTVRRVTFGRFPSEPACETI